MQKRQLPSRAAIARMLAQGDCLLPPGISAKFLADHIANDLEVAERGESDSHKQLAELVAGLPKILTGKAAATHYQMTVLDIFRLLFKDRLGEMKSEETIFSKIKRVDIKAVNDAQTGFFASLRTHYNLFCPLIWFECKNYKEDLDNPALDQLLARLNPTSTQVGYVVCRKVKDEPKVQLRFSQAYLRERQQKLMLWITDSDIVAMADAFVQGGAAAVDRLLKQRLELVTIK